jgi:hypothetical protein
MTNSDSCFPLAKDLIERIGIEEDWHGFCRRMIAL